MGRLSPDAGTMRAAIAMAIRAPSVHNTQPWRWEIGERTVHLYADWSRRVPATDPDGRDLLISCGAALHHLRVALGAEGWATTVHRVPNPARPDHLASVEPTAGRRPTTTSCWPPRSGAGAPTDARCRPGRCRQATSS